MEYDILYSAGDEDGVFGEGDIGKGICETESSVMLNCTIVLEFVYIYVVRDIDVNMMKKEVE